MGARERIRFNISLGGYWREDKVLYIIGGYRREDKVLYISRWVQERG